MNIETKKYYVLFGGNGFIGKNFVHNFLDKDSYFLVIDDEINDDLSKFQLTLEGDKYIERRELISSNVKFMKFDLAYTISTGKTYLIDQFFDWFVDVSNEGLELKDNIIKKELHFLNLASVVGVVNNLESSFKKEMITSQNIVQVIKEIIKDLIPDKFSQIRIWYTSSSEIYGENVSEDLPSCDSDSYIDISSLYVPEYNERSHYIYQKVLTKNLFETLGRYFEDNYRSRGICNIQVDILTLFNVVGPMQDPKKGVFNKFIHQILTGFPDARLSTSTRRYVPIQKLLDYFRNIELDDDKDLEYNNYFIIGDKDDYTGTGKELYRILKYALIKLYPEAESIICKADGCEIDSGEPEIKNRFQSSDENFYDEDFIDKYGEIIKDQVNFLIACGRLNAKNLGVENIQYKDLKIRNQSEEQIGVLGKIIEVNEKDGLVKINGFNNYKPGTVVKAVKYYNSNVKILLSQKVEDVDIYWVGVILGKPLTIDYIGTPLYFDSILIPPVESKND